MQVVKEDVDEHVHRLKTAQSFQKSQASALNLQESEASRFLLNTIRAEKAYVYKFKKNLTEGQLKTLFSREGNLQNAP